jgi:hypothetical protein
MPFKKIDINDANKEYLCLLCNTLLCVKNIYEKINCICTPSTFIHYDLNYLYIENSDKIKLKILYENDECKIKNEIKIK